MLEDMVADDHIKGCVLERKPGVGHEVEVEAFVGLTLVNDVDRADSGVQDGMGAEISGDRT